MAQISENKLENATTQEVVKVKEKISVLDEINKSSKHDEEFFREFINKIREKSNLKITELGYSFLKIVSECNMICFSCAIIQTDAKSFFTEKEKELYTRMVDMGIFIIDKTEGGHFYKIASNDYADNLENFLTMLSDNKLANRYGTGKVLLSEIYDLSVKEGFIMIDNNMNS